MAEQVGRDAVAALVLLEPPAQDAERVAPVHREEAAAVVRDLADPAALDQRRRVADERSEAVVVAHAGDHAGGAGGGRGARRLLGRAPDRLLAEDVLARGARGLDDVDVEHVGRGDHDDVDIGVLADDTPVVGDLAEPERRRRLVPAGGHRVAAHDEVRLAGPVGKERRDPPVGAAVRLAHPAESDHSDPDPHHGSPSSLSSCVSASSSAPPAISWTSCSRVTSPFA